MDHSIADPGLPSCTPDSAALDKFFSETCDGTVAKICAGGKRYSLDCASFQGASGTPSEYDEGLASCTLP